jgi:osmotically-inducible protein OsmY
MIAAYNGQRELPVGNRITAALSADRQADVDEILTAVAAKLQAESAAFADVHATLADGAVILTGMVRSRALKRHAGELTYTVPGVTNVQNELMIAGESSTAYDVVEKEQFDELV